MCHLILSSMPHMRLAENAISAIPVRQYKHTPPAYFRLTLTGSALAFGLSPPLSKGFGISKHPVDKYCLQQIAPFGLFAYLYDMPRWTFRAHTNGIVNKGFSGFRAISPAPRVYLDRLIIPQSLTNHTINRCSQLEKPR
jgi:hypothetical protein